MKLRIAGALMMSIVMPSESMAWEPNLDKSLVASLESSSTITMSDNFDLGKLDDFEWPDKYGGYDGLLFDINCDLDAGTNLIKVTYDPAGYNADTDGTARKSVMLRYRADQDAISILLESDLGESNIHQKGSSDNNGFYSDSWFTEWLLFPADLANKNVNIKFYVNGGNIYIQVADNAAPLSKILSNHFLPFGFGATMQTILVNHNDFLAANPDASGIQVKNYCYSSAGETTRKASLYMVGIQNNPADLSNDAVNWRKHRNLRDQLRLTSPYSMPEDSDDEEYGVLYDHSAPLDDFTRVSGALIAILN